MKVLVISPGALPIPAYKGGAVEALIESYINYNEKTHDYDFTVYTIEDDKNYNEEYKYTNFVYINTNGYMYKINKTIRYIINNKLPKIHIGNAYISKVIKKLKKEDEQYDRIIVENCPFYILKLRKIYPNTPIICHLHNDYLNEKTKYSKKILREYDKVIAISNYIKERVETIEKDNKIETIYNGINIDIFNKEIDERKKDEYKRKYNIEEGDITFLYTGRLIKEKGVKELILAFQKMLKNQHEKNYKLLIIGSKASKNSKKDAYINELIKISKEFEKNIIFTGFIDYKDLPIFHSISNVQVIPSRWGEPLGNVVIEGMASGIKQLVTDDGGIKELVEGTNAKIISTDNLVDNLYNSMIEIVNNKDYERTSKEEYVNNFSEETYSKEIFKLLKKIRK